MFIIFFSFILPSFHTVRSPRLLMLKLFPPPLHPALSLSLSRHLLLFYNGHCNGLNVKEKRLAAFPPVSFTVRVFDQFVTGTSDCASTVWDYLQRVHLWWSLCNCWIPQTPLCLSGGAVGDRVAPCQSSVPVGSHWARTEFHCLISLRRYFFCLHQNVPFFVFF